MLSGNVERLVPQAQPIEVAERLLEDGDVAAAQSAVERALRDDPRNPRALYISGRIETMAGRTDAALELLQQALDIEPSLVEARLELAALHGAAHDIEAARDELNLALHYQPKNAEAQFRLGVLHHQLGELDQAIACLSRAREAEPEQARILAELGQAYLRKERYQQALELLERAVTLEPTNLKACNSLGYAYVRLEDYERAHELFSALCARLPASVLGPRINLGNSLDHTGRFDEAERVYDEILRHEPNHHGAHWNRAHNLLARCDFQEGWQEYRYRLQDEGLWQPRLVPFAPWKGEPLEGKTVVVTAEQGLGDQIMFASCLSEVAQVAAKTLLECDERLVALFRRSFPWAQVVGTRYELVPAWLGEVGFADYHIPAGSLPGFVRRKLDDFPWHRGYLRADEGKTARWKSWLDGLGPGLKVGLSWRGGTLTTRRRLRSLALDDLLPLLRTPGCRFVCLQYGDVAEDLERLRTVHGIEVACAPEAIADYDETAALCMVLDLTVSVCTSVIHLNGALGRPVWVLVPAVPEWRYGLTGERMPWYPSVRLLRQARGADWSAVVERVRSELALIALASTG